MIVAVLGEKGGTGKTTISTNQAGMRSAHGHDVLVVDADRQGSSSYWAEAREEQGLTSVSCVQKSIVILAIPPKAASSASSAATKSH